MAQTVKETAKVLIKKFGKEESLEKAKGAIQAGQDVLNELKYEDAQFLSIIKYWKEVEEEINNYENK